MKKKILGNIYLIIALYLFWIFVFVLSKPLFLLTNPIDNATFGDWVNVIVHGFKLDFCFAAYFLIIPVLLLGVKVFCSYNLKKFLYIYNIIMGVIITIIVSVDCILYSYWGFRMDATLIFYLKDFNDSLNSVTFRDVIKFVLIAVPYFCIILILYRLTINRSVYKMMVFENNDTILRKSGLILELIMLLPIIIICTRGGVSTATANIGMVYYSSNQKFNLAAINPIFSLMYSLTKTEDFSKKYRFYDDDFCKREFNKLLGKNNIANGIDNVKETTFLKNKRPNILVIILESFSANVIKAVNGNYAVVNGEEVTPNLNKIATQSIVFENAYSNGMRTDRGIVSILTGFLAQPDMSIIKYPEKTRNLPTMAKTLSNVGYNTEMIYGGDVNFANMRSFFFSSMYNNVIDYKSFDVKERMSKWGVNDEKTFDYLIKRIKNYKSNKPFFTTLLTLSSHEPFDVNLHKFENPFVNSVAYTDSCIGIFMNRLKATDLWKNTLVIFVADHGYRYPKTLNQEDADLYHIPIIFSGGVIKQPLCISRFVNQTDIPKTVFSAMGLLCEDFKYSRDVFNKKTNNYAVYVYTEGFGFMDTTGITVWDNTAKKVLIGQDKQREMKGKVLLQTLYDDISKR